MVKYYCSWIFDGGNSENGLWIFRRKEETSFEIEVVFGWCAHFNDDLVW